MSLTDRVKHDKGGSNQGFDCSIAVLLRTLPTAESDELQQLLDDPTVSHAGLERAIRAEGLKVGKGTVAKHRRGDCRCFL